LHLAYRLLPKQENSPSPLAEPFARLAASAPLPIPVYYMHKGRWKNSGSEGVRACGGLCRPGSRFALEGFKQKTHMTLFMSKKELSGEQINKMPYFHAHGYFYLLIFEVRSY
jgi:hypothetical protein